MATDPLLAAPRSVQELHRQMHIQRATWRVQRIGWWLLLLLALAGLAGLLGNGPLAETVARSPNADVHYDLLVRRGSDALIRFDLRDQRSLTTLTLPSRYIEAVEITKMQPEPMTAFGEPDTYTFIFAAPNADARLLMTIRPRRVGVLEFLPRINGQPLPTRLPLALP